MTVSVRDVTEDESGRASFVSLADRIYARDPRYCAPFRTPLDVPGQRLFLAERDGRAVARISARISQLAPGPPHGTLGLFESENDPEAAGALLRTAADGLRAQGAGPIVGPMEGDTWHRYRLNVGPEDDPPFLMEPYNPRYYPALWEAAGFHPLESYFSKTVSPLRPVREALRAKADHAENSYQLRALDLSRFDEELDLLYDLSRACFAENFLYTEIGHDEFRRLYTDTRALLDPELVWFAFAADGAPAGFAFAFPDRHRAVAAMRGHTGGLSRLRFWLNRRTDTINFKTVGIAPPYRRGGLASALSCRVYDAAMAKGYDRANLCLIRDGNPSSALDGGFGRVSRRYVLYQLGDAA